MSRVNVISAEVAPRLRLHLVTSEPISAGDIIVQSNRAETQTQRTWRTLQLDCNLHLRNEFLGYVDHSCSPNALLDIERLALIALREIEAGCPVTFFYPGSEVELSQDFVCNCGSDECLGHIKGGFYLTHEQMRWALAKGYCTSFMQAHFERLLGEAA